MKKEKTCLRCGKLFNPRCPVHRYCGGKYEKESCSWYNQKRIKLKRDRKYRENHREELKERMKKNWAKNKERYKLSKKLKLTP